MSCDRMTRLASSPPTSTAAEVSSHDVSMPRTASATTAGGRGGGPDAAPQGDRAGNGAGGEAARRDDGDPRDPPPAAAGLPRELSDDGRGDGGHRRPRSSG